MLCSNRQTLRRQVGMEEAWVHFQSRIWRVIVLRAVLQNHQSRISFSVIIPSLKLIPSIGFAFINKKSTFENLKRRWICGPSCYPLCSQHEESISHLFISFPLSLQVSATIVDPLFAPLNMPIDISSYFSNWHKNYVGSFKGKQRFKWIYTTLPKFVCW